ncbi:hypothetical protein BVC80_1833g85 [Macleaya cordata]|uniref:Uncharacterized protein n=1 Tax=Macleaya cordata TaxID=56857 RepID=A0A200R6S9_MACCD|nr:hypothetical protein BVC80_1833g85 [Macleaya cordata]
MKPRTNGAPRAHKSENFQGQGPNWILFAGGALLSTLSVRLGYKLKQFLDTRRLDNASDSLTGNRISRDERRSGACTLHSNQYSFTQNGDGYHNCLSGNIEGMVEVKHQPTVPILKETDMALPLISIPAPESNRENGVMWASSPAHLELPQKPFHHSNSSDSPCVSESGSDIFSKREVIQKLRQQLKTRDEMILEMQDQIMELQSSLRAQLTHSTLLQSQLDAANRDLFDSEREIQRLRKAIADLLNQKKDRAHSGNSAMARNWSAEGLNNGHVNGFLDVENDLEFLTKGRGDGERIEMLKREVRELKEVIEGKEYLLQSYKEQKVELSSKVMELQQRLASQVPNIL